MIIMSHAYWHGLFSGKLRHGPQFAHFKSEEVVYI